MLLFALNANRNVAYQRDIEKKHYKEATEFTATNPLPSLVENAVKEDILNGLVYPAYLP